MKRLFGSIIMLAVFLIACSPQEPEKPKGDATIQEADLTDFEKNFTDLLGGLSFIHDIHITNDEVKEIHATIDMYKNGEYTDTIVEFGAGISETEKEELIRTVFLTSIKNKNEEQWISAVMSNSGSSSGSNSHDTTDREKFTSSAWGGITEPTSLFIGEKQPIASIVYSNKDSIAILNDLTTENALEQQTDYEQVYIISVELR